MSPEPQSSQILQTEAFSLQQNTTLQLQSTMKSCVLDLHPQCLLPAVRVMDQQLLLCHKGRSALLHLQYVSEGLKSQQKNFQKMSGKDRLRCLLRISNRKSNLRFLIVHGVDGYIEGEPRDGAAMLVDHRKGKLDEKRLISDVLHGRYEGHFHVVHCMLGEWMTPSLSRTCL